MHNSTKNSLFVNYYKNVSLEDFLSNLKELFTPLDKNFFSNNSFNDKLYTDFASALKYFNEDGSVNFAQFLADTANISLYDPLVLDLNKEETEELEDADILNYFDYFALINNINIIFEQV